MAEPPLDAGAVNETVAVVDPVAVAEPIVGAPGAVFCGVLDDGAVITRLFVPLLATATKRLLPKATDIQILSAAEVREVHVMPSDEVITRLPVPVLATATKRPSP